MIPVNKRGETLPILTPNTLGLIIVDGTIAHAESAKLDEGIYRVAVQSTVDDAGCHIAITAAGTGATVTTGLFMGTGAIEYFGLEQGSIVSVINGKINIVPFS
jgi:hypothetical protein